jgi:hypothetical protein
MRFHPGVWQLIRISCISTFARRFVRSPPAMQSTSPGLSLVMRPGFIIMTLRQSNNPLNGKVQTPRDRKRRDRWRAKSRACSSFALTSRELFARICPGRPTSQFRILLWRFMATAWKCAKTSPRTLATKELAVTSRQGTASHFFFNRGIFDQIQHEYCPPPTPDFAPRLFCFPSWR